MRIFKVVQNPFFFYPLAEENRFSEAFEILNVINKNLESRQVKGDIAISSFISSKHVEINDSVRF